MMYDKARKYSKGNTSMEFSLILFNKLVAMMLMAIVGFALVRFKLLREDDTRVISVLLVYVL